MNFAQAPEGDVASVPADVMRDADAHLLFVPEPVTPDSPWTSLGDQIRTAEWVANIGIPLTLAVLAVLATIATVAWQLHVSKKREKAQRRASFVAKLADAARRFAEDLRDIYGMDDIAAGAPVSADALDVLREQTTQRFAVAIDRFSRWFIESRDLDAVKAVHREVDTRWTIFIEEIGKLDPAPSVGVTRAVLSTLAQMDVIMLRALADELDAWDGEGHAIDRQTDLHTSMPQRGRSNDEDDGYQQDIQAWGHNQVKLFERYLDTYSKLAEYFSRPESKPVYP